MIEGIFYKGNYIHVNIFHSINNVYFEVFEYNLII